MIGSICRHTSISHPASTESAHTIDLLCFSQQDRDSFEQFNHHTSSGPARPSSLAGGKDSPALPSHIITYRMQGGKSSREHNRGRYLQQARLLGWKHMASIVGAEIEFLPGTESMMVGNEESKMEIQSRAPTSPVFRMYVCMEYLLEGQPPAARCMCE